jgi:transcriptional regulator with XRE-family HTH domain
MNNKGAVRLIRECAIDLFRVKKLIAADSTSIAVQYLTHYSIIRACGTLEVCYKTIIADKGTVGSSEQSKNYIDKIFRESSKNPSIDNLYKSLEAFDSTWKASFKSGYSSYKDKQRVESSIKSLNENRNSFAHGYPPPTTFNSLCAYFRDACILMRILDEAVG